MTPYSSRPLILPFKRPTSQDSVARLFFMDCPVTDKTLQDLAGLKTLEVLNVRGTRVTAEGVAGLQKVFPKAKILWK